MIKRNGSLLLSSLLCASFALASCSSTHENYVTHHQSTFDQVDIDRSGYLDNSEYKRSAFGMADWDNDGYLEETEWAKYTELYYDPYNLTYKSYSEYDTDGDGRIDASEFNAVPSQNLFTVWDYNDDSYISSNEWDRVTASYTE